MLKIKKNTYPAVVARVGDIVEWEFSKGSWWLKKDGKSIFSLPNSENTKLVGIVGEYKKKGYVLELEKLESERRGNEKQD